MIIKNCGLGHFCADGLIICLINLFARENRHLRIKVSNYSTTYLAKHTTQRYFCNCLSTRSWFRCSIKVKSQMELFNLKFKNGQLKVNDFFPFSKITSR